VFHGSTLSIVGSLILGDAAVSAGLVSPIMIIVVAISMICGLMFSDINMLNALRKYRIIFILFASFAGILGISISLILLLIKLASTTSLNEQYLYPIAPFDFTKFKNILLKRQDISLDFKRDSTLTDNKTKLKKEIEVENEI